ncbi:TonB-dependent receptor [Agriterribacter sp.]|uniref:TonB-dependent receptor domain-containing protein n=1 Tax=Agriterribacter sp. TaxID=2821509 RepID=UPI002CB9CEC3|nr:TonB-dependent receptor [Agriterribacter sp.]HRO44794.1 TonB-dependent receptor [Agriterribacter sp.]HRQ18121.1 TonB-dependent receptor [Agriterribacter sp.]
MKRMVWMIMVFAGLAPYGTAQQVAKQYILTGVLKDSATSKAVAYATIGVWNGQNEHIASTYSLESGAFKTALPEPGKYRLEISFVGYSTKEVYIELAAGQLMLKLDDILLVQGSDYLQEVKITAVKRLVEQRPGMLVYNAENDVTNKGGTAADVLRKAPVLNVDAQGNVSMRGNNNLKILINGKYSGQMARSVADALNMMPAGMIRSVEIITTPSARYDAEGAAGVINIITKKGKGDFSGTLEASVSNLEQMLNPRLSVSGQKWSINLSGHLHRLRRKSEQLLERTTLLDNEPAGGLRQFIEKDNAAPHGSADLAIDYAPDSLSELSFGTNAWFGNWPEDSRLSGTVSLPGGAVEEQYRQAIDTRNAYLGADMNIGYSRRLKKAGQQITLLVQNSPSRDLSWYDAVQTGEAKNLLYRELNNSKTKNREWTFQADYIHPFNAKGSITLEAGTKIILRNVGNRYDVAASDPQQVDKMEPQPLRSDDFRYSQDVAAVYAILKLKLTNNWYIEAGARPEATYISGKFIHSGTAFDSRFVNFIPTATLTKKVNESNTFNLSYTRRLTRPYIWDLNPNVNASDPKNIVAGNPELAPEIADQAELSYGLNTGPAFFMHAAFFYRQTNNTIVEFMETDAQGISYTSKQNLAGNRQFGLNLSSTVNLSSSWGLNGNVNINHLNYSSEALAIFRSGWNADVSINTSYKLPRDFAVQVFGEYSTRSVTLLGSRTGVYYYSFAGKKELKKTKLTITLAAVNLFNRFIPESEMLNRPLFISRTDNRYFSRAVKLTVNWEFGGLLQQKERKRIINNDVKTHGKG